MRSCLAGDQTIRSANGDLYDIRALYERFQEPTTIPLPEIFSLINDDEVGTNEISAVILGGTKQVYNIATEYGFFLRATETQLILTNDGFKEIQNIECGDDVVVISTKNVLPLRISCSVIVKELLEEPIDVYDIELKYQPNFIVDGYVVRSNG